MRFIAEHKDRTDGGLRWGVESICRVLGEHGAAIAPSSYYEAASRPPSKRALRDEDLRIEIAREMAPARSAETRHQQPSRKPSPLAGLSYKLAAGEFDLLRFGDAPIDEQVATVGRR